MTSTRRLRRRRRRRRRPACTASTRIASQSERIGFASTCSCCRGAPSRAMLQPCCRLLRTAASQGGSFTRPSRLLGGAAPAAARRPIAARSAAAMSQPAAQATQQQLLVSLVHNGQPVPCEQAASAFLKAAPRGAYTTARTVNGNLVFKLTSHIQRLATSGNLMAEADARAADHMAADVPLFHSDGLRPLVVGSVRQALQQLERSAGPGHEAKLTLLLTWSSAGEPDLWCHAEPLPQRPKPPVKLQVRGMPRQNAKAKDSEWVRQRGALEAGRPADVNEVLLVGPCGGVMEGLSSNFFVLAADGAVETAEEGVLSGTVRELVLQVCREEGVPVRLQPPRLADIDSWQGAFISSTSRLLLPACEVTYEAVPGQPAVKVFGTNPIVARLEAQVMAEVLQCSEPLDASRS